MLKGPLVGFLGAILSLDLASAAEPTTKPIEGLPWIDLLEKQEQVEEGEFLKHWRRVSCAAKTFEFIDDPKAPGEEVLRCTGKPTGLLRSAEIYENFICEFEWRHMTRDGMKANAGFFVWSDALPSVGIPFSRSIEVQVANFDRDTDWFTRHGDVFAIHGAKMTPDPRFGAWPKGQRSLPLEFRAKETGEWNHYRITCTEGTIQLEVNGKLVSGGHQCFPRVGHLMIESEGGEVHFRKMRLLPLKESRRPLPEGSLADTLAPDTIITPLYDGFALKEAKFENEELFRPSDYRLNVAAGEGSVLIPLQPKSEKWSLTVDLRLSAPLEAIPLAIDRVNFPKMALSKGVHRIRVDFDSDDYVVTLEGKVLVRGKATPGFIRIDATKVGYVLNNLLLLEQL